MTGTALPAQLAWGVLVKSLMSEFLFHCTKCGQALKAATEQTGSFVLCPVCDNKFAIPRFRPQLLRTGAENALAEPASSPHAPAQAGPTKLKPKTSKVFKVVKRPPTAGNNGPLSESPPSPSANAAATERSPSLARQAGEEDAPPRSDVPILCRLQHVLPALKKGGGALFAYTMRLEAWLNGTPT